MARRIDCGDSAMISFELSPADFRLLLESVRRAAVADRERYLLVHMAFQRGEVSRALESSAESLECLEKKLRGMG